MELVSEYREGWDCCSVCAQLERAINVSRVLQSAIDGIEKHCLSSGFQAYAIVEIVVSPCEGDAYRLRS
jgi:uncharacterized alpha-E superfamily protein